MSALARAGIAAERTREPGGSPGGEAIRELLLRGADERWDAACEALLLNAARRDHIVRAIAPALTRSVWVVCDRFADSTLAYQGYGRGMPLDDLRELQRIAIGDCNPDLTLIFDLPAEEGLARAARRPDAADRFERLDRDFHERLRAGFRQIAADNPERCVTIDARGTPEEVHGRVRAAVAARLAAALGP